MDKIRKSKMLDMYCELLSSIGCNSLGLAVSGGSDSMALFYLTAIWRQRTGNEIKVASVDHRLRNDSSNEVEFVQGIVKENRISHFSLKSEIDIKNLQGNIQDNARKVRYDLLTEWAKKEGLKVILLGHTLDDQEENLLIRFFRGSGVDGLASIKKKQFNIQTNKKVQKATKTFYFAVIAIIFDFCYHCQGILKLDTPIS